MGSRNRFKNNKNRNQFGQSVKVGESTSSNSNVLLGGLNRNEKSKRLREIRESQKYRNNLKEKLYDPRSNLKFVNFNDSLN